MKRIFFVKLMIIGLFLYFFFEIYEFIKQKFIWNITLSFAVSGKAFPKFIHAIGGLEDPSTLMDHWGPKKGAFGEKYLRNGKGAIRWSAPFGENEWKMSTISPFLCSSASSFHYAIKNLFKFLQLSMKFVQFYLKIL